MGKSWKSRTHTSTGYPYAPVKVAGQQVLRPKLRPDDEFHMGMYASGHPVFSASSSSRSDMKHLEFLRAYGQYYYAKVGQAYASSCAFLPASCRSGLRTLEDRVNNLSGPLVNGLQEGSERVLWNLDSKVDSVVRLLNSRQKAEQQSLSAQERHAQVAHLQMLNESLQFLKEHGISGVARHAMNRLRYREATQGSVAQTDKLALAEGTEESWAKFSSIPAVGKVLETAEPGIKFTQRKYGDAHTAIISSAAYNNAVEAAVEALQRLQDSPLYKATAKCVYPAISGIADPALERIANSGYTKAVVEHLKPIPRDDAPAVLVCAAC